MLFAGSSVAAGELTLFGVVAAGVLGNLAGSWIAYAVGYYGRLDLLEKNKLIHISPKHLKWADDWFERYGSATVFFSRMLPIVRTFISLPAGVAKMPFWRFTTYTLPARIPWVLALALIGEAVGENWEEWRAQPPLPRLRRRPRRSSSGRLLLIRRRRGGEARAGPRARRLEAALEPRGRRPHPAPAARWRWESSRARPSCCRSPARPTSSSSPGSPGWDWDELDPEVRKSFEVALHAGAAAALLIGQRRLIAEELRELRRRGGRCCSASPSSPPRSSATRSSGRSSSASAGRGRPPRVARRCRGDARRRPAAAGAGAGGRDPDRRPGPRASPRRRRWSRASRATGSPSPPPAGAASPATRRTSSRARSRCRSSSAPRLLKGVRLRAPRRLSGAAALARASGSPPRSPRPSPRSV